MADILYYVSTQRGKDTNTGLSEAQAWATLTKAAQTVPTPAAGNQHVIVWGPGTYREKIAFAYGGRSATERIIYRPDPNCLYLTQDKPGRCRLTGCDANEIASAGNCVNFNSKNYVQFGDWSGECWIDGVKDYAVKANNDATQWCVRINAQGGQYGFSKGANYACTARSGQYGFYWSTNYACTARSGQCGFYLCATNHSCVAAGCSIGFDRCSCFSCIAEGCNYGFSGGAVGRCVSCVAVDCAYGFYSGIGCHFSTAEYCVTAFTNGAVYSCTAGGCVTNAGYGTQGDSIIAEAAIAVGRIGDMPYMPLGVRQRGWWTPDTVNETVTGATLDLSAERLIAFTPTKPGASKAMAVYIEAKAAAGNVTCELQKLIAGTWTTTRSKTIGVADLVSLRMNRFEWDTGSGDDHLTVVANTWRYRITADVDAAATTIRTSNGTLVSYQGYFWPDDYPMEDIDGRPRAISAGGYPSIGAYEPPDMAEEWTTFKAAAPAIRLAGHSMHIMQVPATAGKAITVKWWVQHHGTDSARKPQVWLRGPSIAQQEATCTAAADTWEQISVTATPTINTVLECCLFSRDVAGTSYSIFSDPEVSIA